MVKNLVLLVVLGLLAVNTVSAIKCYQCEDCAEYKEDQLKVCEIEEFPDKPPSTEDPSASTSTTTVSTTEVSSPETKINANKYNRKDEEEKEDNDFRCLKYTEDKKIMRKCTKRKCKSLLANEEITGECKVCEEQGCNFGTNVQSWAFSTIILVTIVKYLL